MTLTPVTPWGDRETPASAGSPQTPRLILDIKSHIQLTNPSNTVNTHARVPDPTALALCELSKTSLKLHAPSAPEPQPPPSHSRQTHKAFRGH